MTKNKVKCHLVQVFCPTLGRRRNYRVRARSRDAAWHVALRKFFTQFPVVLERGLTVGG
jgi:hypothetical protein